MNKAGEEEDRQEMKMCWEEKSEEQSKGEQRCQE